MFRIKICGLTRVDDAAAAARFGADAVGLNFVPASRRCLTQVQAAEICAALPPEVARVGVFVNAPLDELQRLAEALQLDWIQLHGDEPPETIEQLAPRPVLRAVRWKDESPEEIRDRWERSGAAALLLDAHHPEAYGGTGRTIDWQAAFHLRQQSSLPLVLAGGLTPDNVAEAVSRVHPAAVDTASGVESAPGIKDHERMRQFIAAAQAAL